MVPVLPRMEGEGQALRFRHAKRVRRVKLNAIVWLGGSSLITALWAWNQWDANGAFRHFGSHEGNHGDWNPTLWALGVGLWGIVVGIMALRVRFERPPSEDAVAAEAARLPTQPADDLDRRARGRLEDLGRVKFHVAAWGLAVLVLTPLWALIEWQDNGGFERWSGHGHPGDWEPWILYVAAFWALGVAVLAAGVRLRRSGPGARVGSELRRLRFHG